jgi:carbonic anhydrase
VQANLIEPGSTIPYRSQYLAKGNRVSKKAVFQVDWGYEDNIGPACWGDLSPDFILCKTGNEQSPIDIPSTAAANPADLLFEYAPTGLNIVNNGKTIQVNPDAGSALVVDGIRYQLLQFHFHNPSENTVDGAATEMELHLVHVNADAGLAVVGVFLTAGAHNAAYAPVLENMPSEAGNLEDVDGVTVDTAALLPDDRSYWRWDGSLTTPPCTEGVKWFMLREPVQLSAQQIAAYKALYTGNARPVQPMNHRDFIVGQKG